MKRLMTEDTESQGGRPTKADPELYIEIVEEKGMCTTSEVHETVENRAGVNIDSSTARRRLQDLANECEIVKRKTGSSITWMSDDVFETIIDDSTFLDAIQRRGELQTTEEVADETGFEVDVTLRRLQKLEDEKEVSSRNEGKDGSTIWTVSSKGSA